MFERMQTGALTAAVEAVGKAAHSAREALAPGVVRHVPSEELLPACAQLLRDRGSVEAAYLALVAEVDRRRRSGELVGSSGFCESSTEAFLRARSPMTPGQARSDVSAARSLAPSGSLAPMAQQLADGDVTRAHVDVAARCLDGIPVGLRSTPEQKDVICRFVTGLAPSGHSLDLRRATDALLDRLAPDSRDRFDPASLERRYLDLATDSTGMVVGRFALDAAAGATLRAAIDAVSAPAPVRCGTASDPPGSWPDDGPQPPPGLGVDALGRDDRTARQRRADGLATLVQTALGVQVPRRGERPRVVVHATADQLTGVTADSTVAARTEGGQDLDTGALRRLACDAVLQRVVWGSDGTRLAAAPLELGRENRLATVEQRRALAARDRGCIIPGCGAQATWCDAHHIVHWADGGPTDLHNLALLCGAHHSAVHAGRWTVRMAADGIPEVVPPQCRDPSRRPRRAPHHHVDEAMRDVERAWAAEPVGDRSTGPRDWRPPGVSDDDYEPPF